MRDLVDARLPWPLRMPLTDGEQYECWPRDLFICSKNCAPLTSRLRDVELHAAPESGAIVTFLFTTQKPFARNAVAAHLFYDRFDCCLPRLRAAGKILHEHLIEHSNFEAQT